MRTYVRLAALAAAMSTLLIAPSADAACITHSSGTVTLVTVPTPYGPAEVRVPVKTEVQPTHCSSTVYAVIATITESIEIE